MMSNASQKEKFNSEQKAKFIENQILLSDAENVEKIERGWNNLFERMSNLEKNKDKDFALMNNNEIDEFLSKFLRGGKKYKETILSNLTTYFAWCLDNHLTTLSQNVLIVKKVKNIDSSSNCSDKMIKDEDDLKKCLDNQNLFRDESLKTIDNLYRCYLYLLFSGLSINEAFNLLEKDIDLNNGCILLNDKKIALSKNIKKIVEETLAIDCLVVRRKETEIVKTGYLFENTISEGERPTNYREKMKMVWDVAISNKFSDSDRELTQSSILKSGIFYRMYQNEIANGLIDCQEYLEMCKYNVTTIDNPDMVIANCKNEYEEWKKAFALN